VSEKRKEEILERRRTHRKLSRIILEGPRYHETVEVQGLDGNFYEVDVYAMSDGEFRELVAKANLNREALSNPETILDQLNVQREIAAKCIRGENGEQFTAEELSQMLMPLEYSKIFRRVLEISGIVPSALTRAVNTFRPEPV
jgi:hypothetical protein